MRRKLFKITAAVSLMLCLATVVLWVRSYWVSDWVSWSTLVKLNNADARREGVQEPEYCKIFFVGVGHFKGCCELQWGWLFPSRAMAEHQRGLTYAAYVPPLDFHPPLSVWTKIGMLVRTYPEVTEITFPIWLLTFVTAALPVKWAVGTYRNGWRRRDGRCLKCGYDLRATPDRCPECGAVPAEPAAR